jgi:hypothetical protein
MPMLGETLTGFFQGLVFGVVLAQRHAHVAQKKTQVGLVNSFWPFGSATDLFGPVDHGCVGPMKWQDGPRGCKHFATSASLATCKWAAAAGKAWMTFQ